jgi:hypothetical protein
VVTNRVDAGSNCFYLDGSEAHCVLRGLIFGIGTGIRGVIMRDNDVLDRGG